MSENENEPHIFTREFPVEFSQDGDGRTLEARIVPYNVEAIVSDPPYFRPYKEMFVPGAFERQLNAANRVDVLLNFEHSQSINDVVGHGISLESREDALYGKFRIHDDQSGNKALTLVNEGVLTGLSVEFMGRATRMVDGVRHRVKAHLDKVALCRPGLSAYKNAEVLAVRTQEEIIEELKVEESPERVERLQRIGFEAIMLRAIVRKPWSGAAAGYEDDEWQAACVLDRGESFDTAKTRYAMPVLEPNGDLNVNGLHAAASRLNQVSASATAKAAAARKLVRYYRQADETPSPGLVAAAAR